MHAIRFARLQSDGVEVPAGLADLAAGGEIDWLQLDYVRPQIAEAGPGRFTELAQFAVGLAGALRELRKWLFLEPRLHVAASAGWADAFAAIEHAAGALVEGGCGDMPVSAVRGSNLLPILDMLASAGVKLDHAETGAPFRELREPLLAADLQIGAGPIAAAIEEGARLVVAGCFDPTAPLTAAAVRAFNWNWNDYHCLAGAAMAAEAAAWQNWDLDDGQMVNNDETNSLASSHLICLNANGESILQHSRPASERVFSSLRDSLLSGGAANSMRLHADVACRDVRLVVTPPSQLQIGPAVGEKPDGCWRLEILFQAGYAAESLVEFLPEVDLRMRRRIAEAARRQFQRANDDGGLTTVQELQCVAGQDGGSWLHVACQSKSRKGCDRFVDQLVGLAAAHRKVLRLATGRPVVHVHCGVWPTRVPRDAIDIAVETRPAKEWV